MWRERSVDTLVWHIDDLREVMNKVKASHPFALVATVVLPEYLHAIWSLPEGNAGYPTRWSLLKASKAFGIGGIGNIKFAMKSIWRGTWMASITIR